MLRTMGERDSRNLHMMPLYSLPFFFHPKIAVQLEDCFVLCMTKAPGVQYHPEINCVIVNIHFSEQNPS